MINTIDLKNLLTRFFEKDFEVPDKWVVISKKFLFDSKTHPDLFKYKELQSTLNYLRNVMERHGLKTLDELLLYYEGKRKKLNVLFEKLEETNPEECFALSFKDACTMYMKTINEEHKFKSNCLYYLQVNMDHCSFEISSISNERNTPFYPSTEEEIKGFVSQVKGNLLALQEGKCCVPKERINELVSN